MNLEYEFELEEVLPDFESNQNRYHMMRDMQRESWLVHLISDGRWNELDEVYEMFKNKKMFDYYVTGGERIRMEWITNWINKLKGPLAMLKMLGLSNDSMFGLSNSSFGDQLAPDWTWDPKGRVWNDKYDSGRPRKLYWASFRHENIPLIVMTVQHFVEENLSRHMYVSRTLAGFESIVKYPSLLIPLHLAVSRKLKVAFFETNPVPRVREILLNNPDLDIEDRKAGLLKIRTIQSCFVCKKATQLVCGGCELISYCSKTHQKQHWINEHRDKCQKTYKIK